MVYNSEDWEDDLSIGAVGDLNPDMKRDGEFHICDTCKNKFAREQRKEEGQKKQIPAMSNMNNLKLVPLSRYEELQLTALENTLIAKNIIFQYIIQLPKSRWNATKNTGIY